MREESPVRVDLKVYAARVARKKDVKVPGKLYFIAWHHPSGRIKGETTDFSTDLGFGKRRNISMFHRNALRNRRSLNYAR